MSSSTRPFFRFSISERGRAGPEGGTARVADGTQMPGQRSPSAAGRLVEGDRLRPTARRPGEEETGSEIASLTRLGKDGFRYR